MLIDLHCHTKQIKKGDGKARNVTKELFRQKIEEADIKIVGITNHNAFCFDQYKELKEAVKEICQVWPGVEIDIIGDPKYHLIVIANPSQVEEFDSRVKDLFNGLDVDTCLLDISDVCEAFKKLDVIYIAHFHNKKPAMSEKDRDKLIELVNDRSRVFVEPSDHRTLGVYANFDYGVMIGSDVKDWNEYEKCNFAELRLPVGSFSDLCRLARRDTVIVNTLLSKKPSIPLRGEPHKGVYVPLQIYPDINVIFGPKGTGKSNILSSLYEEMIAKGKRCVKYVGSDKSAEFKMLTDISDMEINLETLGIDLCEMEFALINEWCDSLPVSITNYINWIETKTNTGNKARMKITESVDLIPESNSDSNKFKKDLQTITSFSGKITNINPYFYLDNEDADLFTALLQKLTDSIYTRRVEDYIDEKAVELTNFTINDIKTIADKSSDTISRPSSSGLKEFCLARIKLLNAVNRILEILESKEISEKDEIGTIEGKGTIYVKKSFRMLSKDSRTDSFPGYKITELRHIVEYLKKIKEHIFDTDIAVTVDELKAKCQDNSVSSIIPFIGRVKTIVNDSNIEYKPSEGEKGILLLQNKLNSDADAFFLDEPELGMGNSYIDTDIRPLISQLGKMRKYVVVATHNANIAVRTLPYVSIYRIYAGNDTYKTYTGNPFDDKLVNIEDPNDVKSWTNESMKTLEGSRDAFYERKDIYESKTN